MRIDGVDVQVHVAPARGSGVRVIDHLVQPLAVARRQNFFVFVHEGQRVFRHLPATRRRSNAAGRRRDACLRCSRRTGSPHAKKWGKIGKYTGKR